jgi:asparagine synthetase B (glutamine-hydrolysing)
LGRTDDPTEFGLASYPDALHELGFMHVHAATPNTHYKVAFDKNQLNINEKFPIFSFNLNQNKTNFNDWEDAFIESVRKRAKHGAHKPMLSLSSGYDSGAISLALKLLNIKHHVITVESGEKAEILKGRMSYCDGVVETYTKLPPISKQQSRQIANDIVTKVYPMQNFVSNNDLLNYSLPQDAGAQGGYLIGRQAQNQGIKVNLSGSGADEILSDYGFGGQKWMNHSEFGGQFPVDLNNFYPWKKFYGDTQRNYLFKEEIIFGYFGIESRYPMLDRQVVQEFLSLDHHLKNEIYKAPLDYFMNKYNYPFERNTKRGFSVRDVTRIRKIKGQIKNFFNITNL